MLDKIKKKLTAYTILEACFLLAVFCYIVFRILHTTKYGIVFEEHFEEDLLKMLWTLAIVKASILLLSNKSNRMRNVVLCICAAALGFVFWQVFCADEYIFLQFLAIMPLGMVGTDYRKVLKLYAVVTMCCVGSAVIAASSGIITNLVYLNDGNIRSALGIGFPTDYASYFVFALIAAWIGWKRVSDAPFVALGLLSFLNAFFIARSRTSAICSALFVIVVLCHWYVHAHPSVLEGHKRVVKAWSWIVSLAFPLFCAFSLGVVFLYAKRIGLAGRLDGLFSNRFRLAYDAYKLHGLSLFGTPFDQIGAGGSTIGNTNYNFVDNSYWLILLRYGIVLLVFLCVLWVLMARKGSALGDWRLMLGLALIAFHSVSEHHFIDVHYNILLVLPFSVLGMRLCAGAQEVSNTQHVAQNSGRLSKEHVRACHLRVSETQHRGHEAPGHAKTLFWHAFTKQPSGGQKMAIASAVVVVVIALGIGVVVTPRLLTMVRTAWDVINHNVPDERIPFVCAAFAGCVCMVALGLFSLYKTIYSLVASEQLRPKYVILIACNIACVTAGALWCNAIINKHAQKFESVVAADERAIHAVQEANARTGGKLYSTELPALYERAYGGFSSSLYYGDDLARLDNVTVLMSSDYESNCFLGRGFLYTQTSDAHSVYTNDSHAIESLEAAGFHLTGYYSTKHYIDLAKAATLNKLERTQDGALLLDGSNHSLIYGPGDSLWGGQYTFTYKLSIQPNKFDSKVYKDYELGYLRISSDWGKTILKKVSISRSMFDESGSYTAEIPCSMSDSKGIGLQVVVNDGYSMAVHEISYQKTPEYDTRVTYDSKHHKIKEMFYDLEGNPKKADKGDYGRAYEYDGSGNVSRITYLNEQGKAAVIHDGYASLRKTYDSFSHVIREEYYGAEGGLTCLPSGCAVVEYAYDKAGNQVEVRNFDVDGKPTMLSNGFSIVRRAYDEKKRIVREDYYDANDQPCAIAEGYASVTHEYDEYNNETVQRYYAADGKPVNNKDGYAERRRVFDESKRVVHEAYFLPNGDPAVIMAGQSAVAYKYDAAGNRADTYYLDANDAPVLAWNAYAHAHNEFNERGQAVRESYFGLEDEPITCPTGYAILENEYDEMGNIVLCRYLDRNNMPIMRTDGYHAIHRTYNAKNQMVRAEYYDVNGVLCEHVGGYVALEYEYDLSGALIRMTKYDREGNKVIN